MRKPGAQGRLACCAKSSMFRSAARNWHGAFSRLEGPFSAEQVWLWGCRILAKQSTQTRAIGCLSLFKDHDNTLGDSAPVPLACQMGLSFMFTSLLNSPQQVPQRGPREAGEPAERHLPRAAERIQGGMMREGR